MISKVIDSFKGEYFFLSNFYTHPVTIDGVTYPTNEHYFQSEKMTNFKHKRKILATETPHEAKMMGRYLPMREDWEQAKVKVMQRAVLEKFSDPEMQKKLLATGDAILIEGNNWCDNFWGICNCDSCKDKAGVNMLGQLLMQARKYYQAKANKQP